MTTDELRAAGRLRRMRKDSDEHDGGYPATDIGRLQSALDHCTLAEAWLRDHPADDGFPVDEAWIRSLGWEALDLRWYSNKPETAFEFMPWGLRNMDGWGFYRLNEDLFDGSETWLCDTPTRGHVRRLLRALGIETKEATS